MKKLTVRSLILGLLLGLLFMQPWTTPTVNADAIGNCSEIYVVHRESCLWWYWWCSEYQEACVYCQDGMHCYSLD